MRYLLTHSVDYFSGLSPEKAAFRFPPDDLSYAELSRRSNQLANFLIDRGIKKGDRIGIFMNKCLELPIAIYGILKAGAAYVPIDPLAPAERINHIVNDCQINYLISQDSKQKSFEINRVTDSPLKGIIGMSTELEALQTISWQSIYEHPDSQPKLRIDQQDLAYIIFTSGSTGIPKGIMHTHYSGMSYAAQSAATYSVNDNDVLSNFSSLHFDMSTMDYLTVTYAGATTVIISEAYMKLPASLARFMEEQQFTIWYSVPFALIQLLLHGQLEKRNLESIRWVLYGGEPFPAKHLRELMDCWPHARFSNVYGPAEVNQCTYYHLPDSFKGNEETIPIGTIWPNAKGLIINDEDEIIDGHHQPGELVVHTPTMMQGYWNNSSLNKNCFYRHEIYPGIEQTFYRTGDIVSYDQDNQLILHGRKDRQIKLRGYRIELDEIESVFSKHHSVKEAAAYLVDLEQFSDTNQHINYVEVMITLKTQDLVDEDALMQFAQNKLPSYARPKNILITDDFPRTTSGKIDRKSLAKAAIEMVNFAQ